MFYFISLIRQLYLSKLEDTPLTWKFNAEFLCIHVVLRIL